MEAELQWRDVSAHSDCVSELYQSFSISPTEGGCGLGGLRSSPPSQGQVHRGAAEVDLDLRCFIKWTQFLIKSTKIGVFYQYGYIDITINRGPCTRVRESVESGLSALAAIFSALSAYLNNF